MDMKEKTAEEIQCCFNDEMARRDAASIVKLVDIAGTVAFALALKAATCSERICEALPETIAEEIRSIARYLGPIRVVDALDAINTIINAAAIMDARTRIWTWKTEASLAVDEEMPLSTYRFVRRFLRLDWEDHTFTVDRDEIFDIVHNDVNPAWKQLMATLDKEEGTDGLIVYWREDVDKTWEGLYIDENLEYPQLPAMDRMHWARGNIFDYIFYTWGEERYNGEDEKYLFLNGSSFRRRDLGQTTPDLIPAVQ
jgi:hypothetical protein